MVKITKYFPSLLVYVNFLGLFFIVLTLFAFSNRQRSQISMNDLPTGLHNVAALKYRSVGLVEVGGVEHGQGLVDVALQGPVGAVGHRVHQAWDEV